MTTIMSYDDARQSWIDIGLMNGMFYLIVMQDLEDKEYFPVYFGFYSDAQRYQDNIISESKLKVIEFIKLSRHQENNERPA